MKYVTIIMLLSALITANSATADAADMAKTCAACHGANGIASNSQWPNLAGQNKDYLIAQLQAFRDGSRIDPLMSPSAKSLSDQDIAALAAHYANLQPAANASPAKLNLAGMNIRARCVSCHGMEGKPVNSQWPNINGQQQAYLAKQLTAFRDGTRHSEIMKVIVKGFSDQQIADVAEYYSQIPR